MRYRASYLAKRIMVVSAACCLALLAAGCTARGSVSTSRVSGSFVDLTDAQLTKKADVVLLGIVAAEPRSEKGRAISDAVRQELHAKGMSEAEVAQMVESEAETVYTIVLIRPSEVLKGDPGPGNAEVRVLGGQDQGVSVVAADFPTFKKGETVLVFLGREFDGNLGPLAVYRVDGSKAESRDMGNRRKTDLATLKQTIRQGVGR